MSQPIYHASYLIGLLFFDLMIVWVFLRGTQMEKNLAMKLFLKDGEQSEANSISFLYLTSDATGRWGATFIESRQTLRELIGRNNAKILNTLRPNKFRLDETKVAGQQEQLLNLVANSMGPTELPNIFLWIGPIFNLLVVLELLCLYLVIFTVTLMDLCFWLFELRLKLSICTKLLRHYQTSLMFEPLRHVIHIPDRERCNMKNSDIIVKLDGAPVHSPSGNYLSQAQMRPMFLQNHHSNECEIFHQLISIFATEHTSSSRTKDRRELAKSILNGPILCIDLRHIVLYMLKNRYNKYKISEMYAYKLICLEMIDAFGMRKRSKKFLISTYLDFRLFMDQIDTFRKPMSMFIAASAWNALHILLAGLYVDEIQLKAAFILFALLLIYWSFVGSAFFYSQCCKLQAPIHSMLVPSITGDKTIRRLAQLWRRSQTDLTSSQSQLAFGFSSFKVTYASMLQVSILICSESESRTHLKHIKGG